MSVMTKPLVRHGAKRKADQAPPLEIERRPKRPTHDASRRSNESDVDPSIAMMDPSLLADHFAKYLRKFGPDGAAVDLDRESLPTKAFRNTAPFPQPHTADNLPAFLEQFAGNGTAELSTCDATATPHTLIVTASGMRTADVTRAVRRFHAKDSKVAKLIAKHMKLKDNIDYMQKTKVGIAIGTPARLKDLIAANALKTAGLRRIVVDGSHRDEKKRTIFEMEELFRPLMALLKMDQIQARYGADDQVEIMVF